MINDIATYIFEDVQRDHTIEALFKRLDDWFLITAIPPIPGTGELTPEGVTAVPKGGNQMYMIRASAGYEIDRVLVDGVVVTLT